MRLIAYYNKCEYSIENIDTGEALYTAGNASYDSQVRLYSGDGVGLFEMKRFAHQTGKEMSTELDARFIGVEYLPIS